VDLRRGVGDPTANDVWTVAKSSRLDSRTEVHDLFSRNEKAREVDRASRFSRRSVGCSATAWPTAEDDRLKVRVAQPRSVS
jgi:hypothetical protein